MRADAEIGLRGQRREVMRYWLCVMSYWLRPYGAPSGQPNRCRAHPLLSVRLKAVIQRRCIFGEAVQCFKAMLKLELMREAPA